MAIQYSSDLVQKKMIHRWPLLPTLMLHKEMFPYVASGSFINFTPMVKDIRRNEMPEI